MAELWFGISEKTQKEPYDPSVKETKTTNKYDNQRDMAREPSKEKFNGMYNYFKIDGQNNSISHDFDFQKLKVIDYVLIIT